MAHHHPPIRRGVTLVLAAAACAVVAGCGSDDSSSTASTAASTPAAATSTPKATGTKPVGQHTIGIIGNTFTSEILKRLADDEKGTAEAIGWKAVVVDGQASPDGWNQGIDTLLGKKVDAILMGAIEAAPIQKSLDKAKKAGVPVIATSLDVFPDSAKQMTVVAEDTPALGVKAADLVKQRFPDAKVLAEDVSPVWAAHGFHDAGVKRLNENGNKVVGQFDVDLTDLVGSMGKGAASLAQAHPDAKVYFSCCDFGPPILATAFQGINRNDINIFARSANPSTLKLIKAGVPLTVIVPDVDKPIFAVYDRLLSHLADGKPFDASDSVTSTDTPIVDKDNPKDPFPFEEGLKKQVAKWGATYKLGG